MGERYLKSVRLLAECLQGFERFSGESVRRNGLTQAQFDILATLGNTPGMTYKELGDKTLITKGTLTGVVDRLQARGLVRRVASKSDGRSTVVRLTQKGEAEFERVFAAHVAYLKRPFSVLPEDDLIRLEDLTDRLRTAFQAPTY